jgi:DNA-binding NtrC family response regulator
MSKSVLIVDDDQEFSTLLKGIFEQAGYTVRIAHDAARALELIQQHPAQLVVTDERLPGGLSGRGLIRNFREKEIRVPIIMVSGFLNDDAIRDLIRDGVAGVFLKPLNIFSLLKKASDILEGQTREPLPTGNAAPGAPAAAGRSVGRIQGLSEKGQRFIERAREAASFKRNLLLIGPPGTLFEEIGRDIISLADEPGRCVVVGPGDVSANGLENTLSTAPEDSPTTLLILDAEQLAQQEVDCLIRLSDERGGAAGSLRMLFCLQNSVEDLFDAGKVDEEFYLFLGSNELDVPRLKDVPEDLLAIARRALKEQSDKAVFDVKLRSFLLDYDWPENMVELLAVILRAVNLAQPSPPRLVHFEAAMHPGGNVTDSMRSPLERFLREERERYRAALDILFNA